jgi:predicted nuclease of restriction endonuclease-like RecB superfamily
VHIGRVRKLRSRDLPFTLAGDEVVPMWLSDRDRPWLRDLLDEVEAAAGHRLTALRRRWRRQGRDARAGPRRAILEHLLLHTVLLQERPPSRRALRELVFALGANGVEPSQALAQAAAQLGIPQERIQEELFADLPMARRVPRLTTRPDASQLLWLGNRLLAQGLLQNVQAATLRLRGAARAVLRTAWLHGCWFRSAVHGSEAGEWLGEVTQATGLPALLPVLPWAEWFELRAQGRFGGREALLVLRSGDPLLPGPEPRAYDSQLERHFAADFAAATTAYRLLREPAPLVLSTGLAFPDFACMPTAAGTPWLVEVTGLRDRDALPHKLALLEHPHCLLSLPAALIPADWRSHPRVLGHRRRVDVPALLARLAE